MRVWKEEDMLRLLRKHRAPQYLCFPSAVLMDRMAYNKDGGIFAGFFSDDWMRAVSYKYAQVEAVGVVQQKVHLSVVERFVDRKWVKLPRYLRAINNRFADVALVPLSHA